MKKMILSSILALVTVLGVGLAVDNQPSGSSVKQNIIWPDY
jgi:hypothetical protein